ncbi:hypothetical protein EIN_383130 [Entamoeba invadens IP1]|uniref:Uncharacterized protein n=1 Tax=Entamoeba invadens IP1 TaxID=370355 RepID=A0A0A1U108_ENTIV|nr:hypothetical protein EIN_383130 [Entamoeba invadens IP1]ELP87689.1 hypothetical protein EIN_383130 [Entamoeba invadens IP1]|eukprot:XP_004254460.1 hypothetical protein EIN_383130 [Entamoeba invadens IP1]
MSDYTYPLVALLFGNARVGRRAIRERYALHQFNVKVDYCIEPWYGQHLTIEGGTIAVQLELYTDYPIAEAFMKNIWIPNSGIYIIVYSIDNLESFKALSKHREKMYEILNKRVGDEIIYAICGTKSDLENNREVSTEEGERLAEKWGCMFFEISSKLGVNIDEMVFTLVSQFKKKGLKTQKQMDTN